MPLPLDPVTEAILKTIRDAGYKVVMIDGEVSATDNETREKVCHPVSAGLGLRCNGQASRTSRYRFDGRLTAPTTATTLARFAGSSGW